MDVILFTFLVIILLILMIHWRNKQRRPPGPRTVPILGSVPFLSLNRGLLDWTMDPGVTDQRLATVVLGIRPLYVINDFDMARELFEKEEFSGKCPTQSLLDNRFSGLGPRGIIMTQGSQWIGQRRFSLKTLKDFGFGKRSLEDSIHYEVDEMIENVFKVTGDILIGKDFNVPIINILWQIVAGSRFSTKDAEDMKHIDVVSSIFTARPNFLPYPIQKVFPGLTGLKKLRKYAKILNQFLSSIVKEHQACHDPQNLKDFIDVYLEEIRQNREDFNLQELVHCIWDFFLAGTETSSTTLKWILLYLSLHQDVQDRCRTELHDTVGSSRVSVTDLPSLPFLQATISEVQRISCVGPISLPHSTTSPVKIGEFSFPENSRFVANLSFIMNDPRYFDDPKTFNPGRFLSPDGRFIKTERFVPFGLGRRVCMGEQLARNEIFIFTADLLQTFAFSPSLSQAAPDPELYMCNLTKIPDDFYVRVATLG